MSQQPTQGPPIRGCGTPIALENQPTLGYRGHQPIIRPTTAGVQASPNMVEAKIKVLCDEAEHRTEPKNRQENYAIIFPKGQITVFID